MALDAGESAGWGAWHPPPPHRLHPKVVICLYLDTCRVIIKVAPTTLSVLITGETGTGKELVAKAIHDCSPRMDHPFEALNCANILEGLLESEFFGREKGAPTGAINRKLGQLERAHRGMLFLDEVGDLGLAA